MTEKQRIENLSTIAKSKAWVKSELKKFTLAAPLKFNVEPAAADLVSLDVFWEFIYKKTSNYTIDTNGVICYMFSARSCTDLYLLFKSYFNISCPKFLRFLFNKPYVCKEYCSDIHKMVIWNDNVTGNHFYIKQVEIPDHHNIFQKNDPVFWYFFYQIAKLKLL